jgi:cystathionine beta-lyase/cystathionine gamma-synthase
VFTALDAATKANTAGDFATVVSNLQTIVDVTNTFLGPLVQDGLESGEDLTLNETAEDTLSIAQLCASA